MIKKKSCQVTLSHKFSSRQRIIQPSGISHLKLGIYIVLLDLLQIINQVFLFKSPRTEFYSALADFSPEIIRGGVSIKKAHVRRKWHSFALSLTVPLSLCRFYICRSEASPSTPSIQLSYRVRPTQKNIGGGRKFNQERSDFWRCFNLQALPSNGQASSSLSFDLLFLFFYFLPLIFRLIRTQR